MQRSIFVYIFLALVSLAQAQRPFYVPEILRKAFPTLNKKGCESCFHPAQCRTGFCWDRKCVTGLDNAGKAACNRPECSPCENRLVCKSNRCWGAPGMATKCVKFTEESQMKCFPEMRPPMGPTPGPLAGECEACSGDGDCESKICRRGKCVVGTIASRRKCFGRPFCAKCTTTIQCASKVCWNGRCTGKSMKSKLRCFGRGECDDCFRNRQCMTGRCFKIGKVGKCVPKGKGMHKVCFPDGKGRKKQKKMPTPAPEVPAPEVPEDDPYAY